MQSQSRLKGSLTVLCALILVVTEALFFTMAECVRLYALKDVTKYYAIQAAESSFSEYNSYLWEKYHILGMDYSYGSGQSENGRLLERMEGFASENASCEGDINLMRAYVNSVNEKHVLLTDKGAAPLVEQGVAAIKAGLIEDVFNVAQSVGSTDGENLDEKVGAGESELNSAKEAAKEERRRRREAGEKVEEMEPVELQENPLDTYHTLKDMMNYGILYQVLPTDAVISYASMSSWEQVSKRSLNCGTKEAHGVGFIKKEAFTQYLMSDYSNFLQDKEHDGLQYEVEYLIAGKDKDDENLTAVMEQILLIREGVNFSHIMSDSGKLAQVTEVATAICSAALIPEFIPAVEMAVAAAWAYVESVLDVRTLMAGGKVPAIKDASTWTSDLYHLSGWIGKDSMARSVEFGLEYKDYLNAFLLAEGVGNTLALRACDVMENALHTQEGYENVRLDYMICDMDLEMEFSADQLFFNFVNVPGLGLDVYSIKQKHSINYLGKDEE